MLDDPWRKIDSRYGRGTPLLIMSGTLHGPNTTFVTYWYDDGTSKSFKY